MVLLEARARGQGERKEQQTLLGIRGSFHAPVWSRRSVNNCRDFPGGPVVKNLPSNAGDTGSIPARGTKISHATQQLSPRTTTTEPECHHKDPVQPKQSKKFKKEN